MSLQQKTKYFFSYQLLGRTGLKWQRIQTTNKLRQKVPDPEIPINPPLIATAKMKEIVSRHYLQGRFANGVKKVAWVTSGAPIEILRALDFFILYPEKHAAICGAKRLAVEIASEAEQAGFSRDICSYARTDIGAALSGKTPVGRLPKPDLLVTCTNICQTVLYWYKVLATHFKVPLVLIDTPFLFAEAIDHQVEFVKRQIEEMIPLAEQISGKSLSFKKLSRVIDLSKQAAEIWLLILNSAQAIPSPITAFDGFIHLAPIVDQRGKEETVKYYRLLLNEVQERIRKNYSAIKNEEKRVLWDNLPIWFKIRDLSQQLASRNVNVVAATYTNAWGELAPIMDSSRPIESMARTYLYPILNRSAKYKLTVMQNMVRDFCIDGIILHSDRSCKPYSLGQVDQRNCLAAEDKIPALLLEADHNDPRSFADQQAQNRLDVFVEMLG